MAGDPLALVEDLDRPIVDTGIDQLANQTILPRGEQDGSGASTMMRGLRRARDAGRA
ncbi:hypothetical protein ABIF21_003502 [Bradyrhizobium elkanii]